MPAGLVRDHSTKPGVWGLIHVLRGEVIYRVVEPEAEYRLAPGHLGVVEPKVLHSVELIGDAEFFVEFWTRPKSD